MVIWPEKIDRDDENWLQACALMQVLALDPRRHNDNATSKPRSFFESADDYLVRPNIWVDRKQVAAPYFSYDLRFNVSGSVLGSIPIDDANQIAEFKRVVNAALQGELTTSERKRWTVSQEYRRHTGGVSEDELAVARTEGAKALRYYTQVREDIVAPRRFDGIARASLSRHEEVLAGLIRVGSSLLQAA